MAVSDVRTRGRRETPDRFAERRFEERRRRLRKWAVTAIVMSVLLGSVSLLARSSVFRVGSVVVAGQRRQPGQAVVAAAAIGKGTPMWSVDLAAARRRVEKMPRVRRASVVREWPRTVRITITERVPVAAVVEGTSLMLVDGDGVQIEPVRTAPAGLMTIRRSASAAPADVRDALVVVRALPAAIRGRVRRVRVDSAESIVLALVDGSEVAWGSAENSAGKAAALLALLKTKSRHYDVRAPDLPALR
jgi:cell division protein FtsQ